MPSGINKFEQLIKDNLANLELVNRNVSKILASPAMLMAAYDKVRRNPNTKGINNTTLDGIDKDWFDKTISDINTGRFSFKPARRLDIPKPKGGTRPLGIVSPRDKVVLEAMRMILEAIFEPTFHPSSHGFRPNRSCHSALNDVKMKFGSSHWFIEGDISKCFDTIDHQVFMRLISIRIDDQVFIDLLWKSLRAGYINFERVFHSTEVGAPQGSVISPIISNIVLNELDKWIDNYTAGFNKGERRRSNPEYTKLIRGSVGRFEQVKRIVSIYKLKINSLMGNDESFKRLHYVRYADDFLIGVCGSKADANKIKADIAEFISDKLKMSLSLEKTKITHSKLPVRFIGTDVKITPFDKYQRRYITRNGERKLVSFKPRPQLLAPISYLCNKLVDKKYAKISKRGVVVPTRNGKLIHLSEQLIILHFSAILRGTINYYTFTSNFTKTKARLYYILKYSCALTLCAKMKLGTLKKTFKKYGPDLNVDIKDDMKKGISFPKYAEFKPKSLLKLKLNYDPSSIIDLFSKKTYRTDAILNSACSICGSEDLVEMHHINKISNMSPSTKGNYTKSLMIRMNRRQIPVCKSCHIKIHKGLYHGPGL